MKRFTLTNNHVALLQRMCVEWQNEPYEGAPAINIKRPYGNSRVWQDVAEVIGLQPTEDDDGEEHWPKGTRERCIALHRETETALQVCLAAQSFEPGEYDSDDWRRNWRRA